MLITRIPSGNSSELAVLLDGTWHPLTSLLPGANPRRLTQFADRELRDQIANMALSHHEDPAIPELALAPTIADPLLPVWGAGLNYSTHSDDLSAQQPKRGPGSYLRPSTCLVGNGEPLVIPTQSSRVTADAEIGLVLSRDCKNVPAASWRDAVLGITVVLDLTAEDAIRENPRHIPWAKGFDGFCSAGPVLMTIDELDDSSLNALGVKTVLNGHTIAAATPAAMKYDIPFLVEYFTAGRTLPAGTLISTGTPGAAVISEGDVVSAEVELLGTLTHPVVAASTVLPQK